MGRLDRLELFNFKSYGGNVVVGPFKGFTAIIGTNGSGKSNLMDAISFVLGVRTSQLRGNQLRDLVYRNLEDPNDDPSNRKAHVKLVYQSNAGEEGSLSEIEFMRSVTLTGSSEYRVKGKVVSLENYNKELAGIGVLVKARNFLVFQNEVESIASKSPKELSAMFEEISESAEYRQGYERARAEKDTAEEEVTQFWRKRKGMAAERRQYREQKEEAEKFRRLQKQVGDTKTERALFELFHVDEDLRTVKAEVTDIDDELDVRGRQFAKKEALYKAEKKRVNELDKEKSKLERKRKRLAVETEKLRPTEVKLKAEKSGLTRRLKRDKQVCKSLEEEFQKESDSIDSLEAEIKDCATRIASLEKDIRDAEEASVSEGSMSEYRSLKERVVTRTSLLQQQLGESKRTADGTAQEKSGVEGREKRLRDRINAISRDRETYSERLENLRRQIDAKTKEISAMELEQRSLYEAEGERNKVRKGLEEDAANATQALREAKADITQSGRQKAFNEAFEKMRRTFPGVHGRLSDLCQPTQTRYREAVAVIFGKQMDSIVVDTKNTGDQCVKFFKDNRVGVGNFIPLDDIRPPALDESLRRLGGTSRLVIDVVKYSEVYHKAVLYAAGNSVICGTLDEARRLGYHKGRRIKVCSEDGTLINRAGFMTGGTTRSGGSGTLKWDRAEIEVQKRKKHSALRELAEVGTAEEDRRKAALLAERLDDLKRGLSILQQDCSDTVSRAKAAEREAEQSESEIKSLQSQLQRSTSDYTAASEKVRELESRLHGLENELFGDFALRHNIETVQEFEERFVKKSGELREKKLQLEKTELSLRSSLKFHKGKHSRARLLKVQRNIDVQQEKIQAIEENLEKLSGKSVELGSRSEAVNREIDDLASEKQDIVEQLGEKRQELRKETDSLSETRKELTQKRSKMERLQSQRAKLLTAAKVTQVHIPVCEMDSEDGEDESPAVEQHESDGDVLMEGAEDDGGAAVNVNLNVVVDYSGLTRRHRAAATVDKQREMLDSYSETVRSMEQQLERLAPNMKANEHMTDVNEKLEEIDREADAARERARNAVASFEDVKQKRQDRFSHCFNHVAGKIDEVYRQLTRSTAYPMGGNAYLSLEQQDEPYLGGIKFNAMPPTKRFRDMEQLSGGERTVAALALLFAIHDFRPSPFFVLDEVDAALDKLNVGRVSAYVRSRAPDLQTIVISLKDSFYERADALVGIYRDVYLQSSRLLTLDLTDFDEHPEEQ